jgi:hypothetical protein
MVYGPSVRFVFHEKQPKPVSAYWCLTSPKSQHRSVERQLQRLFLSTLFDASRKEEVTPHH